MSKLLNKLGINWIDVLIFIPFALLYVAFGVFWTTSDAPYMAGGTGTLQEKKDIMYYLMWFCALGYAVIANSLILWNRAARGGILAFVIMLGVMVGAFFGLTFITQLLRGAISPSTKILSIAIGDLLVLLPIVTGTIFFIIAWIVSGFSNHLRGQPVTQGLIRLGLALMLIPVIQFIVLFFLPRWDDEVRGVVVVHAMSLGLLWGLFLGGGLGSNLRRPSVETAAAAK